MTTTASIFDRIGGKPALQAVVDDFYGRVLADAALAPFFEGTDLDRQRRHQVAFLAFALGGADRYEGNSLRDAHAGRGIRASHFAAVAGHLQDSLEAAGVGVREVTEILTAAASLQPEIVED